MVAYVPVAVKERQEDMMWGNLHIEGTDGAASFGPAAAYKVVVVGQFAHVLSAFVVRGTGLQVEGAFVG